MTLVKSDTFVGATPLYRKQAAPTGSYVQLMGETYYRLAHYDQMPPFFMSLVSSADHWLFIGSTGGLTAGRINAESALFPYETEDKVMGHSESTGGKTLVRLTKAGKSYLWEPFAQRYAGIYRCERHLYKNIYGNKLIFEEINHDLGLRLRTGWRTGDQYGFVKSSWLDNIGDDVAEITLLDGFQNLLPYGVASLTQQGLSSLLDAYKRSELEKRSGLGIFALSATLSDRPEPSESLQATVAWQCGLDVSAYLLSKRQLDNFRLHGSLSSEEDVCGQPGSYFTAASFTLAASAGRHWHHVADVNQDAAAIVRLADFLTRPAAEIDAALAADIDRNHNSLVRFVAAADGLQQSAETTVAAHHYANVLFNIMRGGIFAAGHQVEVRDFSAFVHKRNHLVLNSQSAWFADLPPWIDIRDLYNRARENGSVDLIRLAYEYLPLIFSRRHGDPSRPWNRFSINLKHEDGSPRLDYEGNWRDIFQNWEPLLLSFPAFTEGVIAKFLNATTGDGYNPYRITRAGIEWEVPEPDNPWANIGYWSDHQIIYLQKLLEIAEQFRPGSLQTLYNAPIFAYANVPYRLLSYEAMLKDWSNTIDFDWPAEEAVEEAVAQMGTDGRLVLNDQGHVVHATMTEKLLTLLLAKLANLVPDGGIWMNTQRPEWNDANNALVGKGLSVVTAAYLRRFIAFWQAQLEGADVTTFAVNGAVVKFFRAIEGILKRHRPLVEGGFTENGRRQFMDEMGAAATAYRTQVYAEALAEAAADLGTTRLKSFLELAQGYVEATLWANERADGLFHAYNTLKLGPDTASIAHLYLMLEGQVAILSSGLLTAEQALALLRQLRASTLYRADTHSYMLYPNRQLPGFMEKNNIAPEAVAHIELVQSLAEVGDGRLLAKDDAGQFHFNGHFRNIQDVDAVLAQLAEDSTYEPLVAHEGEAIRALFEATFAHQAFTGRSGTFFAYEGLGSIYWHMVAKLLLATQEIYFEARRQKAPKAVSEALAAAYFDIREGIGYKKGPAAYGAFPTDPYSHTPFGGGARQPGMTGQVKEEILTRWGELGVSWQAGRLHFEPSLLQADEFMANAGAFTYIATTGREETLALPPNSMAFTFCQTPILYTVGDAWDMTVHFADGQAASFAETQLSDRLSRAIFYRTGQISSIRVTIPAGQLRAAA